MINILSSHDIMAAVQTEMDTTIAFSEAKRIHEKAIERAKTAGADRDRAYRRMIEARDAKDKVIASVAEQAAAHKNPIPDDGQEP